MVLCSRNNRENFTIAMRNGWLCKPLVNHEEDDLTPNAFSFVVQGYNYQDTPNFFRDGERITPMRFDHDASELAYYFVVAAPKGCDHQWILETTDYIEPIVSEGRSGRNMQVTPVRRREGYNRWLLTC